MIKAIFFDMGGVLVNLNTKRCIETFRRKIGFETINVYLDTCHQRGFLKLLESGDISEQELYDTVRGYSRPGTTDEEIYFCLNSLLDGIDPYKVDLIKELAGKYDLYMLSNQNVISNRACRQIFREAGIPMETIFKDLYLSYRMNMLKPAQNIFDEALRLSGLPPQDILFVDDSPFNVETGRKVGMNAVHYDINDNLRTVVEAALAELGAH